MTEIRLCTLSTSSVQSAFAVDEHVTNSHHVSGLPIVASNHLAHAIGPDQWLIHCVGLRPNGALFWKSSALLWADMQAESDHPPDVVAPALPLHGTSSGLLWSTEELFYLWQMASSSANPEKIRLLLAKRSRSRNGYPAYIGSASHQHLYLAFPVGAQKWRVWEPLLDRETLILRPHPILPVLSPA